MNGDGGKTGRAAACRMPSYGNEYRTGNKPIDLIGKKAYIILC